MSCSENFVFYWLSHFDRVYWGMINQDMQQRIRTAMRRTWEAVADDVLAMGVQVVQQDVVVEMVTDADRLTMYGDDAEAAAAFYALEYGSCERRCIQDAAFPEELYG